MFWPKINADIDRMVSECGVCQAFKYQNQKETLKCDDKQFGPWEKVGTDLFELDKKVYLLVIDYYSNFPEVVDHKSTTTTSVIKHMKSMFSRHGIPRPQSSINLLRAGLNYATENLYQS